jgi:hypothetical protein
MLPPADRPAAMQRKPNRRIAKIAEAGPSTIAARKQFQLRLSRCEAAGLRLGGQKALAWKIDMAHEDAASRAIQQHASLRQASSVDLCRSPPSASLV